MGDATKKREWKAWGVFTPQGRLIELWMNRRDAKWGAAYGRDEGCADVVKPLTVTISLAKPKRRAKK